MDSDDKRIVLDYIYNYNLVLVKEYSLSIYDSLNVGWQNYITIKDKSRRKKYKEKIEKSLEKLEKKKIDDKSYIERASEKLDYLQFHGLLNSKFKTNLMNDIKKTNDIMAYFRLLVDRYDEIEVIEKRSKVKKTNEKLDMPYQIKKSERIYKDKDGYCYYHLMIANGVMKISESSLKTEKQLYIKALKDNKDVFKEYDKNVKLAPFEKKRKIYIDNIFDLEREVRQFYGRKMDITYPLEKFYMFSKRIVDGLYQDSIRKVEKKDIFDYLMEVTIENFNYGNVLKDYEKGIKILYQTLKKEDDVLKTEFDNEANRLKRTVKYIDFKKIEGLVPTVENIYDIVSKKIIKNLYNNYISNTKEIEDNIVNTTKYMNETNLVEYYKVYCDVLNVNQCNIGCYKALQKSIVKIFKDRYGMDEKDIFDTILMEKKIY